MRLREATAQDARMLFEWRNDPATRRNSLTSEPVSWEGHVAWLERVIVDPDRALYVAEDDRGPVGTGRLDDDPPPPVISITIAPERRGEGLATELIQALAELRGPPVVAIVEPGNERSLRAFEGAGFRRAGAHDGSLRLVWEGC